MRRPMFYGLAGLFSIYFKITEILGQLPVRKLDQLELNPFDHSDEMLAELWSLGSVDQLPRDDLMQTSASSFSVPADSPFRTSDHSLFEFITGSTSALGSCLDGMITDTAQTWHTMHNTESSKENPVLHNPKTTSSRSTVSSDQNDIPQVVSQEMPSSNDRSHEHYMGCFDTTLLESSPSDNESPYSSAPVQHSIKNFTTLTSEKYDQNRAWPFDGTWECRPHIRTTDLIQIGAPSQGQRDAIASTHLVAKATCPKLQFEHPCIMTPRDVDNTFQADNKSILADLSSDSLNFDALLPSRLPEGLSQQQFAFENADRQNFIELLGKEHGTRTQCPVEHELSRLQEIGAIQMKRHLYLTPKVKKRQTNLGSTPQNSKWTSSSNSDHYVGSVQHKTKNMIVEVKQGWKSENKCDEPLVLDLYEYMNIKFAGMNFNNVNNRISFEGIEKFLRFTENKDIEEANHKLGIFWNFVSRFLSQSLEHTAGVENPLTDLIGKLKNSGRNIPEDVTESEKTYIQKCSNEYSETLSDLNMLLLPNLHGLKEFMLNLLKKQADQDNLGDDYVDLNSFFNSFQWVRILSAQLIFKIEFFRRVFVPNDVQDLDLWVQEGRIRSLEFLKEFWYSFQLFHPKVDLTKLHENKNKFHEFHARDLYSNMKRKIYSGYGHGPSRQPGISWVLFEIFLVKEMENDGFWKRLTSEKLNIGILRRLYNRTITLAEREYPFRDTKFSTRGAYSRKKKKSSKYQVELEELQNENIIKTHLK